MLVAETAREVFNADVGTAASVSPRTFREGEVVVGRYELRRFIARGGMGEVYEAFDRTLGEPVALKTLSPTMLDQPKATSALIAEVRLARKVLHPNVCRIHEFSLHRRSAGDGDVIPFLTMELLEGETLTSRLRRDGPLDLQRALRVLRELADGLAAVHRAGIVHRDFKTDNVYLARAIEAAPERAVVMDFGLARALDINRATHQSSARTLAGTVAYMAPEQVEGASPMPAFDVYALGTVAFELLCGRLPFVAESQLALATLRLRHEPPRPSSLRPGLEPVWDWFVGRCLARDAGSRFQSMEAVTRALQRIEAGDTVKLPRLLEWSLRPGVVATAIAVAGLGGAIAGYRALRNRDGGAAQRHPALAVPSAAPPATLLPRAPSVLDVSHAVGAAAALPPVESVDGGPLPSPGRAKRLRSRPAAMAVHQPVPAPTPSATSAGSPGPGAPGPNPGAPPSDDDFIDPFSHLRRPAESTR